MLIIIPMHLPLHNNISDLPPDIYYDANCLKVFATKLSAS